MIIVYDKKDRRVITSFTVNTILDDDAAEEILVQMYPNIHSRLGLTQLDNVSGNPINCDIELVDGMVYSISQNGDDIFRVDPEELKKLAEKKREKEREEIVKYLPVKKNTALKQLIFQHLKGMRQTLPDTKKALEDNSWFKKNIDTVGWWGSFLDAGGYANMNREIVQRLHNYNIVPYISIYPTISQMDPQTQKVLKIYSQIKPKRHDSPFVYAFTPMPHDRHPGKRIFFTMMETSSLHPDFVNYCNRFSDEVWVPSQSNRNLFVSNGVKVPTKVIPLGIDELLYFSEDEIQNDFNIEECSSIFGPDKSEGLRQFKFLTLIQWNMRKGYDALIKAFVNAFDDSDDVCLVIATQYPADHVASSLYPYLPRHDHLPQVLLYNRIIPVSCMPQIYRACDAYIHMSRGEGFSLTQIEAASQGLPIISCYHSGMTEYLTEDNSFPIECSEIEPCDPELAKISYFYQNQTLWKVGPQQVDQAVDRMRFVYKNYSQALKKGQILKEKSQKEYTWRRTAERVAEALRL